MNYNGFHQQIATFSVAPDSGVEIGSSVKLSASGEVSPAADGDTFIGFCVSLRDHFAGVQLCGAVECAFSGAAPALGYTPLAADGSRGVKSAASGRERLVLSADDATKTVTFIL